MCPDFQLMGNCITVNTSKANLRELNFANQTVSMNVTGSCLVTVYSDVNYRGRNMSFPSGSFEAIPPMHKSISSIKLTPKEASEEGYSIDKTKLEAEIDDQEPSMLERAWVLLKIRNTLQRLENRPEFVTMSEIEAMANLSLQTSFLTPFTDLYLQDQSEALNPDQVEPSGTQLIQDNLISYNNLSPVYFSMDDPDIVRQWHDLKNCKEPVKCEGSFHFEQIPTEPHEFGDAKLNSMIHNCTGSIEIFTKPDFKGDTVTVKDSLYQLYHEESSQRMRSVRTQGDCCWLLFDRRFYSGDVDKICGSESQALRTKTLGSVKMIGPATGRR